MKYTDIINILNKNNISIVNVDVASACTDIFDFDYTDEEYEALCTKVEKVFMSQSDMDCDIDAVAHAINDFIAEKEMSISEVLKLDRDIIIEQASYWI